LPCKGGGSGAAAMCHHIAVVTWLKESLLDETVIPVSDRGVVVD